jgi:HlyD family secretion protein
MRRKWLLGCGLPLILFCALTVIGARSLLKAKPKPERSETAQRGDVEIKVTETGTIEPLHKEDVKSKVGGRVLKLYVDAGARVRTGQILASIDPQEINSEVDALRAQLASAQAHLASARKNTHYQQSETAAGIDQYRENLAAAKAKVDQATVEAQAQPKLTSQSIQIAQANLDAAQAAHKAQQDALALMVESTHPQAVVSAQAAYDQALAQAENADHNIERQQKLLAKGFVSQSVVDSAQSDARVADAHLREVKARLDRMKQTNALEEANARSQVANAAGQVRQMEAALEQAKTSVLPETTRRELESARAAYAQAKAQLASALAGKTQDLMRRDDAAAAAADVQQIENQLKERLVSQRDTTLLAPMDGVVTRRYVEEGELITSAIASFSSGTPVFQVADLATMLIKINVNEVDIEKVKPGMLTEVTTDAVRGVTFTGRVSKVAPAALADASSSSGNGSSGASSQSVIRFPVEIRIDHADPRLKPGMSARCSIIVARRRNVLRLPTNCVEGTGDKGTVKLVVAATKDGTPAETTVSRPVTVGLRGDDFVEIVSGLNAGDKVRPNPYHGPPRKAIDIQIGGGDRRN